MCYLPEIPVASLSEVCTVIAASVALAVVLTVSLGAVIGSYGKPGQTLSEDLRQRPSGVGNVLGAFRELRLSR
jgi:hypothetical protein